MLLSEFPYLKEDQGMIHSYNFLIDFLDVVSKEASTKVKVNQRYLQELLEAAKTSEDCLNSYITTNRDKV